MTIDELKRALVEVRDICEDINKCIDCPFHKINEYTHLPYCPLCAPGTDFDLHYPYEWDTDDWKENGKDA